MQAIIPLWEFLYENCKENNKIYYKWNNSCFSITDCYFPLSLHRRIYEQWSKYVKSLPESEYRGGGKITKNEKDNILKNRYPEELKDALNYLK